jgi:hypothetical protein
VTYNFDPEKWYENQRALIEKRRRSGELSESELEEALDELDRRFDELWQRLDGTFDIPD